MTPRALTVELLDLHDELVRAEGFDLVSRQVVDILAGSRMQLARSELRRRIMRRWA